MSTTSADTNLFLYAANPASPFHQRAIGFFSGLGSDAGNFVVCELVLVELYMQLRNPAVLKQPLDSADAARFCDRLRTNPEWQHIDYAPEISVELWNWASTTSAGFTRIIDARLALTLKHHGIGNFATANTKNFLEFEFERVWNPLT